jgi:hypothetical protein
MEYPSGNQDGSEVIDVSQGWSNPNGIANSIKQSVAIMVGEHSMWIQSQRPYPSECVWRKHRSGDVIHAIDSVGIPGESPDPVSSVQSKCEPQQKRCISTAVAIRFRSYSNCRLTAG